MNSTDMDRHSLLNKLYVQAADNLLSALGMEARLVREPGTGQDGRGYLSVLGAACEGIDLSSMLSIDRDLLIRAHLAGFTEVSERGLEDWCRELNNQLVGRLKNKLLRYGVAITLGVPVLPNGTDVASIAATDVTVAKHCFQSADGRMTLTLATRVAPSVEIRQTESSAEGHAAFPEGSVSLF